MKPTLWCLHILIRKCSRSLFTFLDLKKYVYDIIKSIADNQVKGFVLSKTKFSLSSFQLQIDFFGELDPSLNIDDELALVKYKGPSGTVDLAAETLLLMKE